jgi:hypothetical protein
MPNRRGLSNKDKNILVKPTTQENNFGVVGDYAILNVYDSNEELYDGYVLSYENFILNQNKINLDIGQHLRDNFITDDSWRVEYIFYRPIAGSNETLFIDKNLKIIQHEIESKIVGGKRVFTSAANPSIIVNPVEDKYIISKLSKDRTEIEIRPQQIKNSGYVDRLFELHGTVKYTPTPGPNTNTGISFNSTTGQDDDNSMEFEKVSGDSGFSDKMIGATITIPDVYRVLVPTGNPNPHSNFLPNSRFDVAGNDATLLPSFFNQPDSPYIHTNGYQYIWKFVAVQSNDGHNDSYFEWDADLNYQPQKHEETRPYVATITAVNSSTKIVTDKSWYNRSEELDGELLSTFPKPPHRFKNLEVEYTVNDLTDLTTYMTVGDVSYLITNVHMDKENDRIYVKSYSPLEKSISESDLVFFVIELISPFEEKIKIVPFDQDVELNDSVFLALPNMDGEDIPIDRRGTIFKSYENLVGSNATVRQEIEDKLVSGSLLDVKVNVDYQKRLTSIDEYNDNGFGNFINFSSVEERLTNFKYKLDLIENYTSQSGVFTNVSSGEGMQSDYDTKVTQVKNSFDAYEYYLYHESSSYVSSSAGEFHDTSWPKENSSSPYTLSPTTASVASTWYDTMIESASLYDQMNDNRLVNNLPGHVRYDGEGKTFITFMDMIGQQFDETWIYLKHFTDINDRRNKLSKGISKDIVKHVAKSSGLQVVHGNDLLNLSEYLLGKDIDDGSQTYEKAQEEVTEEIWKRILANLPFFQRTKGTTRAIKGLLNCYGIPSTILRVREYGGPEYDGLDISYDRIRKFTYALDYRGTQYIEHLWTTDNTSGRYPETVEFRFRTPTRRNQTIIQKGNDWAISLLDGGITNKGKLKFQLTGSSDKFFVTSSTQQFYNDEMWSVMLTRKSGSTSGDGLDTDNTGQSIKYELVAKQYDATRFKINYQTSASFTTSSADLNGAFTSSANVYLGGSGSAFDGNNFTGSLMEYRLWTEPLSQSKFDNHVRAPKAYNGNTTSSHADNLVYRNTFDENIDLSGNYVSNSVDNRTYSARSGSQSGYSANLYRSINEVEEMKIPNIGASRRNSNKIRIEGGYLTGSLAPDVTLQKSSFDFAPVDSNKLGVYFSPTDIIDKDIIYSLADVNYDDYIGDPRDQYRREYRGLKEAQQAYWKKYSSSNNFWDYLRILKHYDSGIFKQIKSLIPARANATLGVLVEPNILNRSKEIIGDTPEYESLYYENAGEFDNGVLVTRGTEPYVSQSSAKSTINVTGEYPYHEGESKLNLFIPESGSIGTLAMPSRYRLNERIENDAWLNSYATASITKGDVEKTFKEVLNPVITGSRYSEKNYIYKYYFHSDASASRHPTVGINPMHIGAMSGSADGLHLMPRYFQSSVASQNPLFGHYSHSLELTDRVSLAADSVLFRAFYKGMTFGADQDHPDYPAVEITITSPTRFVSKEPGESRLVEDDKLKPKDTGFMKGE